MTCDAAELLGWSDRVGSLEPGRFADLVAVDVQDAVDHVGSITGIVTSEDVLDRIFSEFCIGK